MSSDSASDEVIITSWTNPDSSEDHQSVQDNESPLFNNVIDPFNSFSLSSPQEIIEPVPESLIDDKSLIGLLELPKQDYKKIAQEGAQFTILVAGDRGLGKTTFINTLFEPYETPIMAQESYEIEGKTVNFTIYESLLQNQFFKLTLRVIDTPGFYDTNNDPFCWVPIASYIDALFRLRYFQEEQPVRTNLTDPRVHVCIYFIQPCANGLTQSDITSMANLCDRVNLIPVISKADSFTKDQISIFKKLAWDSLNENHIGLCSLVSKDIIHEFPWTIMPFSLICSDSYVKKSDGELVRGRAYNWGIAEVENELHCDFNQLKELLMSTNMLDFITGTENFYLKYRCQMLQFRFQQQMNIGENSESSKSEDLSTDVKDKLKLQDDELLLQQMLKCESSFEYIHKISTVSFKIVEEYFAQQNPIFLRNQLQIKRNFATIVSVQEKKFKEWKGALVAKQKQFNKEIHDLHKEIIKLQEEIKELGFYDQDEIASSSADRTVVTQ